MYRATDDAGYSNYLVANANWFQLADMNEFSWDNKYAGTELLFATVRGGGGGGIGTVERTSHPLNAHPSPPLLPKSPHLLYLSPSHTAFPGLKYAAAAAAPLRALNGEGKRISMHAAVWIMPVPSRLVSKFMFLQALECSDVILHQCRACILSSQCELLT